KCRGRLEGLDADCQGALENGSRGHEAYRPEPHDDLADRVRAFQISPGDPKKARGSAETVTWRRNRYKAIKTVVDGILFDSKGESKRYAQLKLLHLAGEIPDLKCQPAYPIDINGHRVCVVVPDFRYRDQDGQVVVEDFKSPATAKDPVYRLKKKL